MDEPPDSSEMAISCRSGENPTFSSALRTVGISEPAGDCDRMKSDTLQDACVS